LPGRGSLGNQRALLDVFLAPVQDLFVDLQIVGQVVRVEGDPDDLLDQPFLILLRRYARSFSSTCGMKSRLIAG
jgi:hypothetical protein